MRMGPHDGISVLIIGDIRKFVYSLSLYKSTKRLCEYTMKWQLFATLKVFSPKLNHMGTLISDLQPAEL